MKNITIKLASIAIASLMSLSAMTSLAADASAQWVETDGKYSYTDDETGKTLTGWQDIDGSRYYLGKNGVRRTGWVKINGKTYYFGKNGKMRTGKRKIGSKVYDFGKDGVMKDAQSAVKYSASEVLSLMKKDLGSSYTCDNIHDSGDLENIGFDMKYVNSCAYEDDSISAINYDLAIVVNVKSSYVNTAVKLLQDYYQQILSVSKLYDADIYRVEQARIFSQDNYVALLILGDDGYSDSWSDDDKADYAFGEALKVDKAWKSIFGSTPENLAEIDEDEGSAAPSEGAALSSNK